MKYMIPMLEAIQKEIVLRKNELGNEKIQTIYFGGGTPSVLKPGQVKDLLECIGTLHNLEKDAEVTLEANPEDLEPEYLNAIKDTGINRLSIGIQSFHDEDMDLLNRSHDGRQARIGLENAVKAGFNNLNLDLIYGLPGSTQKKWRENLKLAAEYFPAHVSAYHLTYESGTVLNHRKNKKRIRIPHEEESLEQFNILIDHMEGRGYQHYEISNFARDGYHSRHNMSYWEGKHYLGFGPSAHSYNGRTRRWNPERNSSYIRTLMGGSVCYEEEILDNRSRYHEYLITNLRIRRGIDPEFILKTWGSEYYQHFMKRSEVYLRSGRIVNKGNRSTLSRDGMFISDYILSDLFMPV